MTTQESESWLVQRENQSVCYLAVSKFQQTFEAATWNDDFLHCRRSFRKDQSNMKGNIFVNITFYIMNVDDTTFKKLN